MVRQLGQAMSRSRKTKTSTSKYTPPVIAPQRWKNWDIPHRYREWSVRQFPDEAKAKAENWLADKDSWSLYLWGALGTRKSGFAAAIIKRWRMGFDPNTDGIQAAYFVTIDRLVRYLLNIEDREWVSTQCRKTQLLVLDDLGALDAKSSVLRDIIAILRHRYDAKMKVVVTSNLSIEDFGQSLDERLADRFREGEVMFCGKESKR